MKRSSRRSVRAIGASLALTVLLGACASEDGDGGGAANDGTSSPDAPPATVAELYAEVMALGLDDAALDAYLYERALLEEGPVVMEADPDVQEQIAAWAADFSAAYPGLEVAARSSDTDDFIDRVLAETRAGRPQVDVATRSATVFAALDAEGLLAEHAGLLSPPGSPAWSVTRTGQIDRLSPFALVWATDRDRVPPPASWDDLLGPDHAGCTIPTSPSWVLGLVAERGPAGAERWLEAFLDNGGQVASGGATTQLRRLAVGEIDCVVYGLASRAEALRVDGASIDWAVPEGSPAIVFQFSVLSTTTRPYTAALLVRWAAGAQGAAVTADAGELSVRADAPSSFERLRPWQDPDSEEFGRTIPVGVETAAEYEAVARDLVERYLVANVGAG